MAPSAKSLKAAVTCSSDLSPLRSPSATASARPWRCRLSVAPTVSPWASSAATIAASLPCSTNVTATSGQRAAAARRNGLWQRARSNVASRSAWLNVAFMTQLWPDSTSDETHSAVDGCVNMNFGAALTHRVPPSRDHDEIRLDLPNDKLGIASALRDAFAVAAQEPCDIDFDRLLRDLH